MYEVEIGNSIGASRMNSKEKEEEPGQVDFYKQETCKNYQTLLELQDVKWEPVVSEKNVKVFTFNSFIKVEAFLRCSPNRLFTLVKDNSIVTRSEWDSLCEMNELSILEEYPCDEDNGHIYLVGFNLINTWFPREFIGIQWIRKKDLMTIFRTTKNPIHSVKPGRVEGSLFFASWIENMDEDKSYITQIYDVNLNGWIKRTHIDPQLLIERLYLMEHVANNTKLFTTIYSPWKCSLCLKMIPPHELECRHCRRERYTRCPDLVCMEAQQKRARVCWKCGIKLL